MKDSNKEENSLLRLDKANKLIVLYSEYWISYERARGLRELVVGEDGKRRSGEII